MRRLGLILCISVVLALSLVALGRLADSYTSASAQAYQMAPPGESSASLAAMTLPHTLHSGVEQAHPPTSTAKHLSSRSLAPTAQVSPSATISISSPAPAPVIAAALQTPTPTEVLPPLRMPETADPLPLSLGWRFSANGHLTDGAVSEGAGGPTYYMTSLGRRVYALNAAGGLLWQAQTAGPAYTLAVLGPKRVAVGDDAGEVALLNGRGRAIWRHDIGSRVTALAGAWHGCILAGGWDERLSCLNVEVDGDRVRWQAALDGPVGDIALLPNLALVATLDGAVIAYDPSGAELWRFDAGSNVSHLGAVEGAGDQIVLAALQNGHLLALGPDGSERWRLALHAEAHGGPVWHTADLVADHSGPELVIGLGGSLPMLALATFEGEVLWRVALPSAVSAVTAAVLNPDDGLVVLAGLSSGEIQAYDASGHHRSSVHAGLSVWGLHSAEDGQVLALADVVAWQLRGARGTSGGPWLDPPKMLPTPPGLKLAGPGGLALLSDREGDASWDTVSGSGQTATLVFLGDVAPGRSMEAQLARYGPAYAWTGLESILASADLAVANLECVLSDQGQSMSKPYVIRSHPRWGQTLAEAGFDLVTLANNHALDYGDEGLDRTLAALRRVGVRAVGAGQNEAKAHQPAVFSLGEIRVAVLGYAASRWYGSQDVPATDRIAWAEPKRVQADVRAARDQADFVVVLLHAGTEYARTPSTDQVAVARAAIRAGAGLVVGHHPHVTQTVEQYRGGLIVYSLGDALFDIPRQPAMRGHMLRVRVTQDGLAQAELLPFWIHDTIQPRLLDDGHGAPRVRLVYP